MKPTARADAETEYQILTTDAGLALLARVSLVASPSPNDLTVWRKDASAEMVSAALRIADSRRRAKSKFSRADQMWLEKTALEQSTAEAVARHKAQRFAGRRVVDLCCGIGGDAIAIAEHSEGVLAVDLDPAMLRRMRWNADVYEVGNRIMPIIAKAESFPIPSGARIHIDPDRRAKTTRKSKDLDGYVPSLDVLKSLPSRCGGGAIKLGPASDFADHFASSAWEIELVSLNGECKEATAWFGDLKAAKRRATTLPSGATFTDREGDDRPRFSKLGAWIHEPDPALIRAGLVDRFASTLGLSRFASGIDLLTSAEPIASPWLSSFEVLEVLSHDLKVLQRALTAFGFGSLEIKTRGVDTSPEELRKRLRLEGTVPGTLFMLGGTKPRLAIFARRTEPQFTPGRVF